jgi:hypothetical protein
MGLNVSKGNMYDWVSHTWNTVKGKCPHDCSYCYMKQKGKQRPVRFDEKELNTDLGIGNSVFIGSSCDMFANGIPEEWILRTMNHARRFKNRYLYQSKNPKRMYYLREMFGDLDAICTTIETNRIYPDFMGTAMNPDDRAYWLSQFPFNRLLTIEPIMDFDLKEMINLVKMCNPVQVNIGADSCDSDLPEPTKFKIIELIIALSEFTQVKEKRNIKRLMKEKKWRQLP